jgi:hypothetical protein
MLLAAASLNPVVTSAAGDSDFRFGTGIDAGNHLLTSWLDIALLDSLHFNDVSAWATNKVGNGYTQLSDFASRGMSLRATNPLSDSLNSAEQGWVVETLARDRSRRSDYHVWQAEDTIKSEGGLGLWHAIGQQTSDGWTVDDSLGDTAGVVQTGPWVGMGLDTSTMRDPHLYTIQYRMRLDADSSLSDTLAICKLTGETDDADGDDGCGLTNPYYDSTLRVGDFRVSGSLGGWKIFEFKDVQYVTDIDDDPDCPDAEFPYFGWNVHSQFKIEWFGVGRLEIDWTRCVNANGRQLVIDSASTFRNDIKATTGHFAGDSVWCWFGRESGYYYPFMIDAFRYVDSLVQSATGGNAFVFEDLNAVEIPKGSSPQLYTFYMYRMLRYANMKTLFPWYQPFRETEASHDVDYINAACYDTLTMLMSEWIMPWVDTVPGFRVIPNVQVWSDVDSTTDVSPTVNDVVCQSFSTSRTAPRACTSTRTTAEYGPMANGTLASCLTSRGTVAVTYSIRHATSR